jgi:hypothetical protein
LNDLRPQRLELSPSGAYAGAVLAVHAAAAGCFLTTMTGFPGMALALLTFALGGVAAWDRALLRGARSPRAIEIPASGAAQVVLASGETMAVRAVRGIGVTRHWVALAPLSLAGRSVLITAAMLGPSGARNLRLWALWGRTRGAVRRTNCQDHCL